MPDAASILTAAVERGLTVPELAQRYRVGEDKVRGWITRGELQAVNTADVLCGRPRYVVTHEALAAFEARRTAGKVEKPKRRKKSSVPDYYPD
jgi:transposase